MSMSAASGSNRACTTKHSIRWLLCYLGMSEYVWTHITLGASYLGCMCTCTLPKGTRVYNVSRKVIAFALTRLQSPSQLVLGCCVGVLSISCGCTEHLLWVAFETMSMSAATGSNCECTSKHFAHWLLCYLGMSEHAWTHITLGASYLGCMCTEPIGANRVYITSQEKSW